MNLGIFNFARLKSPGVPRMLLYSTGLLLFTAQLAEGKPMNDAQTTSVQNAGTTTGSDIVYIGTYTGRGSEGIYRYRLNRTTAELEPDGLAAKISSPSFLAISPDGKYLYCCNEVQDFQGKRSGAATSFGIQRPSGDLNQLDQAPSGGTGPCYVSVTPDGRAVLLANYTSGSVSLLPVNPADGSIAPPSTVAQHTGKSVVEKRQAAPHAHCFLPDPTGTYALAVDLGIDQILAYRLAPGSSGFEKDAPVIAKTAPGAGPRHVAFHPGNQFVFASNELDSTATSWKWDVSSGKLTEIDTTTTLPADFNGKNTPAEILAHPNGQFVYLSNRGHNSVITYKVDQESGRLTTVGFAPTRGDHPRGMELSPDGAFLLVANQNSDSLVVYRINQETGMPEFASEHKGISRPTSFVFLP